MVVFSYDDDISISDDHVKLMVCQSDLLARKMKYNQQVSMVPALVRMSETELDMWIAFDLCPVVTIYSVYPGIVRFKTEQVKS